MLIRDFAKLQPTRNGQEGFDEIPLIYFVQPFPFASSFRRFVTRGYKELQESSTRGRERRIDFAFD